MPQKIIISCEHAGNLIPASYTQLFNGSDELLQSHRGYDIGALELAQHISQKLDVKLHFTEISRLLVEANRSLSNSQLFSEFTDSLPAQEKKYLLDHYYRPYRSNVEELLRENKNNNQRSLHFSIHTFTPELNGEKRTADIGLLFDPARQNELQLCLKLAREIKALNPELVVKENYPYLGTDDGFTTSLRSKYSSSWYTGIEIEVNQKFPQSENREEWRKLQDIIASAISHSV